MTENELKFQESLPSKFVEGPLDWVCCPTCEGGIRWGCNACASCGSILPADYWEKWTIEDERFHLTLCCDMPLDLCGCVHKLVAEDLDRFVAVTGDDKEDISTLYEAENCFDCQWLGTPACPPLRMLFRDFEESYEAVQVERITEICDSFKEFEQ